jgi:5-methyltetrahydrofolate--homocysteine methyltransferase
MTILEALRSKPLLADGAMGTQLQQAGMPAGACGELCNLQQPEVIVSIHRSYVEAGAQLITTNTFGASRIALERHDLQDSVVAINRAGVELARRAAGNAAWVLGDMGPIGGLLAPLGPHEPEEVRGAFQEQAHALLEAGVDGILVETMAARDEMQLAVAAALAAGAQLVIATMALDKTRVGARTMMGESPEQAARAMQDAGAAIIGANCGSGLELADYVDVVAQLHGTVPMLPLMVQPNAGKPRVLDDGGIEYPASPAEMAAHVPALCAAGASIVGGCCGTTPAHIRAALTALLPLRSPAVPSAPDR